MTDAKHPTIIDHPESYKEGWRILMRKSRNKDGAAPRRTRMEITGNPEEFDAAMESLVSEIRPGERIYCPVAARNIGTASRRLRENQLAAEYDPDPTKFYERLHDCWVSCLMNPGSQVEKLWILDCDTDPVREMVAADLAEGYDRPIEPYWYETKNGWHCVVQAFNPSILQCDESRSTIHKNAMMLWAHA